MGVAFPSAWRILQISLMFSRCWGSLCQQPSMTSYTSLGQTRGRSKTRPWVMHSMTWKSENGEVTSEAQPENVVHRQQKTATSLSGSGRSRDLPGAGGRPGSPRHRVPHPPCAGRPPLPLVLCPWARPSGALTLFLLHLSSSPGLTLTWVTAQHSFATWPWGWVSDLSFHLL